MRLRHLITAPPRFVLAIGNEGGLLLEMTGGRIRRQWLACGLDDAALATLRAPLAAAPSTPLAVVCDLLEQAYRKDVAPKVNRMDRGKVLQRRLERAFPDAPLKGALALGDHPDDARSQRYLLAAVPPAEDWDRWAGFLDRIDNPIVALSLLPVEASGMVVRLAAASAPKAARPHSWAIWIARQSTGGFRQIVVRDGELALTRLTPSLPAAATAAEVAAEVQQELRATLGYMTRLGYRAGGGLDVLMLGAPDLRGRFDEAALAGADLRFLSIPEAARALGLDVPAGADTHDGALLCAAWAGRARQPRLQLLSPHRRSGCSATRHCPPRAACRWRRRPTGWALGAPPPRTGSSARPARPSASAPRPRRCVCCSRLTSGFRRTGGRPRPRSFASAGR